MSDPLAGIRDIKLPVDGADKARRNLRQLFCKNADFQLKEAGTEIRDFEEVQLYSLNNTGCANQRRQGSAHCQACSDAWHRANGTPLNSH